MMKKILDFIAQLRWERKQEREKWHALHDQDRCTRCEMPRKYHGRMHYEGKSTCSLFKEPGVSR